MNVSSSFMDEGENNMYVERSSDVNYSKTANKWYLARSLYDGIEDRNLRQVKTLLLSKGADPNTILPEYGMAPIHLAVGIEENEFGFEATKIFIANGADPNVKSLDGLTPVHIAALWGRTSVLQLLLANGGNPWLLDGDNKNAFCLAHEQDQWETLKLLDSFKNSVFFEQPEQSSAAKYKLRLDRVKVFNKDVCAEYKALPMSLKCCSTQTTPTMTARSADCCTTASELDKALSVIKREKSVTRIKAKSKTVSSKNNEYVDDAYNIKFNLYPSNQELQALELVRKHRKGIKVFEYVPEAECNGEDSDSGSHENDSRCSRDNSISGSLNSLVRGSVFADVKSKLKLFYKNMSSSNNNCTWRKNLIQKRKDKEHSKKESSNLIKNSTCNFNDIGYSEKDNTTAHSSKTYIVQPKNSFSNTLKHKEIHSDSKINDNYNSSVKSMDENKINLKKSYSCIWRSQSKKEKSKNRSLKRNDESDLNIHESFHRFEDVIESFTFDNTDKIITECNKKDSYMNETINCNDDSLPCNFNADNTDGIGSSSPTVQHNIGFVIGDENDSKTNNGLYDSSFMVHEYKREIGFTVNDALLKTCLGLNEQENNTVKKCVNTSSSQTTNQHQDSFREINQEINIKTNDSSGKESCIKDNYVNKIFDESAIFTEDDSYNSHEFICFDSKNSSENKDNIMKINNNSNNINSTKTSVSEIYFSCTSFQDSKKNLNEKQLVTESVTIPDINTSFINNESASNNLILNQKISEKHIKDIMIYETDNNDSFANENLIKSKPSSNCDNKKLPNEAVTNTPEKIVNFNEHNSLVAEFGSTDTSLVLPSDDCHNCLSDCSETTNKFGDQIFPIECSTSPHSPTSNSCVNNLNDITEYIPSIQICSTSSSNSGCDATNFNQVSESNGVQETNSHKWTCADVISSDEETDVSIIEEYLYTDEDDGIELVEERHLPIRASHKKSKQTTSSNSNEDTDKQVVSNNAAPATGTSTESESESALSSVDVAYETDALRKELKEFGLNAGPITGGTKRVYLRQLKRARRKPVFVSPPNPNPEFSPELERLLRDDKKDYVENWSHLESDMSKAFENPDPNKRWREGIAKNSFTYLLLDPRVTQDLPYRYYSLNHKERLMCFLQGIFYVGRGKRSRPYSHLNEALEVYNSWKNSSSKKINRILDIWRAGLGVVCLHIFQNVIPAEAMTREAAMIDALGLQALCNERVGDYYGSATTWSLRQRQQLGAVLLNRALHILIGEGERQIKPRDVSR